VSEVGLRSYGVEAVAGAGCTLLNLKANVRYVYFKFVDGYYESWDLAAVHPQTLMASIRKWLPFIS